MEFIRDIHARKAAAGQPVVSFEFFPPKTDEGGRTLLENTLPALKAVQPDYCPGIIPILSAHQIQRFTALGGAALPALLLASLEKYRDDDQGCAEFGIEYATQQCAELLRRGVPGLHFYTLNKARSAAAVVRNLSLGR